MVLFLLVLTSWAAIAERGGWRWRLEVDGVWELSGLCAWWCAGGELDDDGCLAEVLFVGLHILCNRCVFITLL